MPLSFDPLSGLSPHHCFVLRGVKGCCYQRLAGLASAVLGRLAEWGRSYQQREPLPSARTSVSSSPAPRANYTLIARLEHSPIRVGPFWNELLAVELLSPLCFSFSSFLFKLFAKFVLSPKCCCYERTYLLDLIIPVKSVQVGCCETGVCHK